MDNVEPPFAFAAQQPHEPAPIDHGWLAQWQDYRHWRSIDKIPAKHKQHFNTKDEAEEFKRALQCDGIIACVTPSPELRAKPARWQS